MTVPSPSPLRRFAPLIAVLLLVGLLGVSAIVAVARRFMTKDGSGAASAPPDAARDEHARLAPDTPELFPQRPFTPPSYRREELVSKKLEPSAGAQTVSHADRLKVIVPGGLLKEPQTLSIAALTSEAPDPPGTPKTLARWSIALGNMKEFDKEVTLELAFDPALPVENEPPQERYRVSCFDEQRGVWTRVPFEVDAARHVLIVRTKHLSDWEVDDITISNMEGVQAVLHRLKRTVTLKSWDAGGNERDSTVCFLIDPKYNIGAAVSDPALIQRNAKNPALKSRGDPGSSQVRYAMPLGDVMASYFEMVWETYHAAKFRLPASIDVLITLGPGESPCYKSMSGNMFLPTALESATELRANLAHELFHVVQNQYINGSSMFYFRAWWMEATADYAAGRVAWKDDPEVWKNLTRFLKPYYLEKSITYFKEATLDDTVAATMRTVSESDAAKCAVDRFHNHHYQTAIFVDHLVRKAGIDFHEMMESTLLAWGTNAVTPLDNFLTAKLGDKRGLYIQYRDFASGYLFAADSRIPAGGLDTTVDASMKRRDALSESDPVAEWTAAPEAMYSAQCWEIQAACTGKATAKVLLTVDPKPDTWEGTARVFLLKGRKRVPDPAAANVALFDGYSTKPVSVDLAPEDGLYVLAYTGIDKMRERGFRAELQYVKIRRPFHEVEKGIIGHEYAFGIEKSGIPAGATWKWEFSDGGAGTDDKVVHTYKTAGAYRVKLTAEWEDGKETDETRIEIAADVPSTKYEVSFGVYRRYKPPGKDPTTGNPWKISQHACQEFSIEVFTTVAGQTVPVDTISGNQTNGVATMSLLPGSYTYTVKYRYTRPVEDAGTQKGSFTVKDTSTVVDVETPSNY